MALYIQNDLKDVAPKDTCVAIFISKLFESLVKCSLIEIVQNFAYKDGSRES